MHEMGATGVPLAVGEDMPYAGGEEEFAAGDILVIYSDGIPEAPLRGTQGKVFYCDDRQRARELRADDVTLVVVRRT
ncbi:MAG: SpoIIE family protein phosphatase [Candidatus Eisenbacteria bacterium]